MRTAMCIIQCLVYAVAGIAFMYALHAEDAKASPRTDSQELTRAVEDLTHAVEANTRAIERCN